MRYLAALAFIVVIGCGDGSTAPALPQYEASILSETPPDSLLSLGEPVPFEPTTGFLNDDRQAVWHEDGTAVFWDGSSAVNVPMEAQDVGPEGRILGTSSGRIVLWEDGTLTEITSEDARPIGIAGDGRAYVNTHSDGLVRIYDPSDGSFTEFEGNDAFHSPSDTATGTIEAWSVDEVTSDGSVLYAWSTFQTSHCAVIDSSGELRSLRGVDGSWCLGLDGENGFYLLNISLGRTEILWEDGASEIPGMGSDLNRSGLAVGMDVGLGEPVVVLGNSAPLELSSLVDGWTITQVAAINNHGEILAAGVPDGESEEGVLLLIPK